MKKVWSIANLDCAGCAAKLEDALASVPGVESVSVNFLAGTIALTASDERFDEVAVAVLAKAARVEPEAVILTDGSVSLSGAEHHHHEGGAHACKDGCCCHNEHEHEHKHEHEHEHAHASHHHDGEAEDGGETHVLARVGVAAALTLVALLIPDSAGWLRVALFLAAYLCVSFDVLLRALRNIRHGQIFDENFLMTVASLGAVAMQDYLEAIAVMALYQIGEWFQDRAVEKSRASIASLMDIRPDYANLLRDGESVRVDPRDVAVGDLILLKPGEKVPLDGVIVEGSSSLNTVALTGESLPRDVSEGDSVISGCINLSGVVTVRVSSTFGESTVAKILEMVEASGEHKASSERFITRFARYYTPAVCAAALLLALIPPLLLGGDWRQWLEQALSFLVISCPCALVISVPLTFFSGIGGASRKGILVKGASMMETLARLDTVAFDKTGTLTRGEFGLTVIHAENGDGQELLATAALAESYSDHPISRSLLSAHGKPVDRDRVGSVEEIAGQGVIASIDSSTVHAGNARLMASIGLEAPACDKQGTIIHVARDGAYMGHLVISDGIKPTSRQAMDELKALGVTRLVMLTGDRKAAAGEIAGALGIGDVRSELLPGDKVHAVESLLGEGHTVGFVGDGINDAPVLRRADLGIAMGAMGSDAAIEAADVVLMDDDPVKLARAIRIARRTMRIVHQNIAFALGVKGVVLLLGLLGVASMWLAVFADVGVAMLAILNAMRAMR